MTASPGWRPVSIRWYLKQQREATATLAVEGPPDRAAFHGGHRRRDPGVHDWKLAHWQETLEAANADPAALTAHVKIDPERYAGSPGSSESAAV